MERTLLLLCFDFCLMGLDEERSLQKKVGYTKRIAFLAFLMLLPV